MANSRQSTNRTWIHLAFGSLVIVAVALAIALYLVRNGEPRLAVESREIEPIEVLPREPDGVTIILKKQQGTPEVAAVPNPAVENRPNRSGFAIHLGTAKSFSELSARFAEIGRINQELLLDELEPRATLEETQSGLEARLMVGPFETMDRARAVCANIALPAGVECEAGPFGGELIARE